MRGMYGSLDAQAAAQSGSHTPCAKSPVRQAKPRLLISPNLAYAPLGVMGWDAPV